MYVVEIQNGNISTEIHGANQKLLSGNVVKGINTIDSFSLSMLPSNDGFNKIQDYKTLVTVYDTIRNRYEYYGRFLYSKVSMSDSGKITKEAICESFFGFLCDSMQDYVEEQNWTVDGLLRHVLSVHNSQVEPHKRFEIGEVTVTDPNDNLYVGIQRENTWNTLKSKLIDKLGGELRFRVVDGVIYLDYLERIGETLTTEIALSKNMKAITREDNPSSYISRLIPLGAKIKNEEGNETEERVDITSVNNGVNYIESAEAVERFGIRYGTITFDDVLLPTNLLRKCQEYLAENNRVQIKYSITALDLSLLGLDIDDFDVYNYHPIKNALIGIDDVARIIKKTIDVCNRTNSKIEVGDNFKTLSDLQLERDNAVKDANQKIEGTKIELQEIISNKNNQTNNDLREAISESYTSIIKDCDSMIFSALQSYTETGDFEAFKETTESQIRMLSDRLSLEFTKEIEVLKEQNGVFQTQYENVTTFFTFEIDGLTIGKKNNPYKVIISNDEFKMTVNGVDVLTLDPEGRSVIPELVVNTLFSLFGYVMTEDEFGNVNCEYGGDN
jgi:hypothetical protein